MKVYELLSKAYGVRLTYGGRRWMVANETTMTLDVYEQAFRQSTRMIGSFCAATAEKKALELLFKDEEER